MYWNVYVENMLQSRYSEAMLSRDEKSSKAMEKEWIATIKLERV